MVQTATTQLDQYYETVKEKGKVLTLEQTELWSRAVLNLLGHNMGRRAKKSLANALPEELANQLTRVFWLLHFRNTNLSAAEFFESVARRSGHMDKHFARVPTTAVFHALKQLISNEVSQEVADDLAPELSDLWQNA